MPTERNRTSTSPGGDLGHAQPSPQAADDPPRLHHRRRRPGGLHFVDRAAHDRRRRQHADGDECQRRPAADPTITDTVNNGINELFVPKRANYTITSRAQRSFPLSPGPAQAL
jgi:hypothetical protein